MDPGGEWTGALRETARNSAKFGWRTVRRASQRADLKRLADNGRQSQLILGAGHQRRPGWLSTDILPRGLDVLYLDISKRFPFPDASVKRIYAEHVIEHVSLEHAENMLSESFRVLEPGGHIRIATPDLTQMGRLTQPLDEQAERYVRESNSMFLSDRPDLLGEPVVAINRMFRCYGHQFLYDEAFLRRLLGNRGYTGIVRRPVGESQDEVFVGMEEHGRHIGDFCNRFETLLLEATRP
ncbi:MAG: methyltransferase domain-containing protein, partial [Actinomycetota bacterium]|nr:methyltransferase domain-containing protein [Actinomycetota bacterium]